MVGEKAKNRLGEGKGCMMAEFLSKREDKVDGKLTGSAAPPHNPKPLAAQKWNLKAHSADVSVC